MGDVIGLLEVDSPPIRVKNLDSFERRIDLQQAGISQAQVFNVFDSSAETPVTAANAAAYSTQGQLPPYGFRWLLLE